jgi:hypothetical protein
VRALLDKQPLELYSLTGEQLTLPDGKPAGVPMKTTAEGWQFHVNGTGFEGKFQIELDSVPEDGYPVPVSAVK